MLPIPTKLWHPVTISEASMSIEYSSIYFHCSPEYYIHKVHLNTTYTKYKGSSVVLMNTMSTKLHYWCNNTFHSGSLELHGMQWCPP